VPGAEAKRGQDAAGLMGRKVYGRGKRVSAADGARGLIGCL